MANRIRDGKKIRLTANNEIAEASDAASSKRHANGLGRRGALYATVGRGD
jgi:hypothetical protein